MEVRASKTRPEAGPSTLPENYPRRVISTLTRSFPPSVAGRQPIRASGLGVVAWFTGLSGAGKTTLARAAMARLHAAGQSAQLLDGDDLRLGLCAGLGFRRQDREESLRRVACAAELVAQTGSTVLVATISPYEAIRQEIRQRFPRFVEIYVNAPLRVCERRDPKGLYRRARAGEIAHFTGLDDIYEPPSHPEVECRSGFQSVAESVELIVRA